MEGISTFSETEAILTIGFSEGNRATWDMTGSWILKMSKDYPETKSIWLSLAENSKAEVRYRVACYIGSFPDAYNEKLYLLLSEDKSKKVSEQAKGKWHYYKHPEEYMYQGN